VRFIKAFGAVVRRIGVWKTYGSEVLEYDDSWGESSSKEFGLIPKMMIDILDTYLWFG